MYHFYTQASTVLLREYVYNLTLIPCIRDIARRGLKALSVLMVLNAWIPPAPHRDATKLISDTITIIKSSQHHAFVKYF